MTLGIPFAIECDLHRRVLTVAGVPYAFGVFAAFRDAPDEFEQSDVFRLRKPVSTGGVEIQRQAHLCDLTPEWVEEARRRMAGWQEPSERREPGL